MYKLINTGSFNFDDAPVQLMDLHSRGVDSSWMQKRSAVLTKELKEVRPEPGKTFIHLVALGDGETVGCNRNADYFSKQSNIDRHHTFVTNGHVYKHHKNTDPAKASGQVKASAHNDKMGRVELIVALDNGKWDNELQKLASGEDLAFSMATRLPFDVCSICGKESPNTSSYCDHMKKHAGQILEDGRQVYVENPNGTFFDISGVFRPADRIAYNLQKVASAGVITGAELARQAGLHEPTIMPESRGVRPYSNMYFKKLATLRKLSEIEKEISLSTDGGGGILDLSSAFEPSVCGMGLGGGTMQRLADEAQGNTSSLMAGLTDARISLPLPIFLKLLLGEDALENVSTESVESRLPGVFTRMLEDDPDSCASDGSYDPNPAGALGLPQEVKNIIEQIIPQMSVSEGPSARRINIIIANKKPRPRLTGGGIIRIIKTSEDNMAAEMLAREYAKYKLSFLTKVAEQEGEDAISVKLSILQNYVC